MKLLVDTQLLLWAAGAPSRLSSKALTWMNDADNALLFSPVSIWEVAIKSSLGREDFAVDPSLLRRGLIDNGWLEVAVTSKHAVATSRLPALHKDPFDRMLIAQAMEEGVRLITADRTVAAYAGSVVLV